VFLLNSTDKRIYGPFGGKTLLQKFDVFNKRDSGEHIHGISTATLNGVSLSGEVVSMTASIAKRPGIAASSFTVALVLDRDPVSDFFSHGLHLPMDTPRNKPFDINIPRGAWESIIGHRLFSAQYPQATLPRFPDVNNLAVLQGRSLRGDDEEPGEVETWSKPVASIPAVVACNAASTLGPCEVEHLALLKALSSLQVLHVSMFEPVSGGYDPSVSFPKRLVSYVIIDSDTGELRPIDASTVEAARKDCALFRTSKAPSFDLVRERPEFALGVLDDTLFAYRKAGSMQFVRLRSTGADCSERLIPDPQVFAWQFLPEQDLVLAQTRTEVMVWKLGERSTTTLVRQVRLATPGGG
jgi:hypothetical protein